MSLATAERLVWASRPFVYGPPGGETSLDPGQVIELMGMKNDAKLLDHGLLRQIPARTTLLSCRFCGAKFIGDGELMRHGRKAHGERELNAQEQEEAATAEDKQLDSLYPLNKHETISVRSPEPPPVETPVKRKGGWPKGRPRKVQV